MRGRLQVQRLHNLSRLAGVGFLGSLAAACSSDTMRFADSPFSNPFASSSSADPVHTGSTAVASAPTPVVTTAPISTAVVQSQPLGAPTSMAAPKPTRTAAVPAPSPHQAVTSVGGKAGWTAAGGTPITVAAGESLTTISDRYGVPANAILSSNGLSSASQVTAGRQITIPVYNASGGAGVHIASTPPVAPTPQGKLRFVEGPKPAPKPAKTAKAGKVEEPKRHLRPHQAATEARRAEAQKTARIEPKPAELQKTAPVAAPAPQPKQEVAAKTAHAPAKEAEQTGSLPSPSEPSTDFRWPARGRVIAGFGANGGNEGINIAVPDGTPVKAAEAGVVTYAGSEVKGYGNLVLIKHDNGYVSAYAHNGELNVKRGERVKRGQVVARSGQTGNVTSPQLHFEIRKGQTPIDPVPHLSN